MKLKTFLLGTALAGLFAGAAEAQVSVKIGVLNDRSGLYADISGEGSVVAARMAAEDFKAKDKGINVEIISADHQNKPDVGSNIARQWYDTDGVDVITDVPTSSVALAINQITKEKNKVFLNSGAGLVRPHRQGLLAEHRALDLRHLRARPTAPAAPWSRPAATPGSSSPPTTPSGTRSSATPTAVVTKNGGKVLGARSAIPSRARTSPPSCCRPRPRRPR